MNFEKSFFDENFNKNDFQNDLEKYLRELVKKWGKKASAHYADLKKTIDEIGGWDSFIKRTWNGEEKEIDIFSFKDCIEWVKKYFDNKKHSGAAVGKIQDDKKLLLKVSFIDPDEELLSDEESPYLIVRCNDIDKNFKNQFGDKNLIILK